MAYKDTFLSELVRADHSGLLPQLHDRLAANGLKFRASTNSDTLLYYIKDRNRSQIGLAAFAIEKNTS